MSMSKYVKVGWKDTPDKTTPLSSSNLARMEEGISDNRNEIINLEDSFISDSELTTLWSQVTS